MGIGAPDGCHVGGAGASRGRRGGGTGTTQAARGTEHEQRSRGDNVPGRTVPRIRSQVKGQCHRYIDWSEPLVRTPASPWRQVRAISAA